MKRIIILYFLLFALALSAQEFPLRVLFVGNSYTAVNDLPQMFEAVSESAGRAVRCESNTPGGCTFEQHCSNQSMSMIMRGGWDVVVLQEQSQIPSFPLQQVEQMCFPFAAQLVDSVYSAQPCSRAMFYMTWGRKEGDSENCRVWPPVCTYEGMDSLLFERYMAMAVDNQADVAPVGAVWHYLREAFPEVELYSGDGSHPSLAGSYAAACTFYSLIFRASPAEITTDFSLSSEEAEKIRSAVKAVVFERLSEWQFVEQQEATADFTYEEVEPLTIDFQNLSEHADRFLWSFGDGTFSEEEHPRHCYEVQGNYAVSLVAANDCFSDSVSQKVVIITEHIHHVATFGVQLFPNPVHHSLTVVSVAGCLVELINSAGVVCYRVFAEDERQEIDFQSFSAGVYFLRVLSEEGVVVRRVVKI